MNEAEQGTKRRDRAQRELRVGYDQATQQQEPERCRQRAGAGGCRGQSDQAAEQPRRRQREHRPSSVGRATQPCQQRQRQRRDQILGAGQKVHQAVVDRAHAGCIQVRFGRSAPQCNGEQGDGVRAHPHRAPRASCDRLPQEEDTARCDHRACAAQQLSSPWATVDRADADAHRVQAPGRDHEAHAVEQGALAGRKFGAVRMAVEDREASDHECRDDQRRAAPRRQPRLRARWPTRRSRTRRPASARRESRACRPSP